MPGCCTNNDASHTGTLSSHICGDTGSHGRGPGREKGGVERDCACMSARGRRRREAEEEEEEGLFSANE